VLYILAVATLVIIYLCYTWMQSTRASQRRTEAQNQRVVELLEEILTELRAGRSLSPAEAGSQLGDDPKTTG
jgi:Flp pilus assembly protein TadB